MLRTLDLSGIGENYVEPIAKTAMRGHVSRRFRGLSKKPVWRVS